MLSLLLVRVVDGDAPGGVLALCEARELEPLERKPDLFRRGAALLEDRDDRRHECLHRRAVRGLDPRHTDPSFTLKTYATAVKHRQRLTKAEQKAYDEALEWAQMGTNATDEVPGPLAESDSDQEKSPPCRASRRWALVT